MELTLVALSFFIAFALVHLTTPAIMKVSKAKHLYEPFEDRKVHTEIVPPLGGIAIFIGFTLSSIVSTDGLGFDSLKYIIASVIAMFFIGLKDDMLNISARKKLVVQILAAVLLITLGGVRFTNLHGIFLTHDIDYLSSFLITLLAMVAIVNAFNLVDGIDGLASGLAILAGTFFGVWFYLHSEPQFAIMSFALVGSLAGFFVFNVFGKRFKMFMGDTGSLIVGLVISTIVVKFNEFSVHEVMGVTHKSSPAIAFAVIIVPLIDTLRVMTIRLMQGKSPFYPDRNHIHHRILDMNPSHLQVTMIIIAANLVVIAVALLMGAYKVNVNIQFAVIFMFGVLLSQVPSILHRMRILRRRNNMRVVKKKVA